MKVGVVILNYNGWEDTLFCVESVLASADAPTWIVIVDNASVNDSVSKIRQWAAGDFDSLVSKHPMITPCTKPITLIDDTSYYAEPDSSSYRKTVVLLQTPINKGYAAGNNLGLKFLMEQGVDAVWLLNNDTIVDKFALGAMYQRLFSKNKPGLCGSLVCYMNTNLVQCRGGGRTNPWTSLSHLSGYKISVHKIHGEKPEEVENNLDFIYGASVMVSRKFIETVGLMDERYFLYCEEQDWAYSAKGKFDLAYAHDAVVYHKEGASTGFSNNTIKASALLLLVRSRLLLTLKHYPLRLPIVICSMLFAAIRMFYRRLHL
ncbi:glycosyltransferase family 2 protein [Desulfovibrio sp.]|uniref:glycosyltransferase family 2 protein n=1 Tax=Desulfovibrio sp. TaxID=885 RepID=UPI0025BD9EB8|nr:glycosyltransferase family 2 protein [Desulfovibrio sp.]